MSTNRSSAGPTPHERIWAMLAHLSALLTVAVAAATGGMGYVVALLVPFGLYLYFGSRSRYVAFHSLQATVFQALAGILYVMVAACVGAVIAAAWVISGLLAIILVGLLLMPVALGLTLVGAVELAALPVLGLYYALRGAYLTFEGQEFDYPWVGRLVARSMHLAGPAWP